MHLVFELGNMLMLLAKRQQVTTGNDLKLTRCPNHMPWTRWRLMGACLFLAHVAIHGMAADGIHLRYIFYLIERPEITPGQPLGSSGSSWQTSHGEHQQAGMDIIRICVFHIDQAAARAQIGVAPEQLKEIRMLCFAYGLIS